MAKGAAPASVRNVRREMDVSSVMAGRYHNAQLSQAIAAEPRRGFRHEVSNWRRKAGDGAPYRQKQADTPVEVAMIGWALTFLVIGLIAAALGFTTIAGASFAIAKFLAAIFLILFVVFLVLGMTAFGK